MITGPLSAATGALSPTVDPVRKTAGDLERAFIQEMLKHAGLVEAFAGEGGAVSDAFSGFLLQAVAEQMTDSGGFGLAERFHTQLSERDGASTSLPGKAVRL